ncbi:MAG TPA: efflux RND transporter permease subunit [Gemmataceae bacterium]|nr:efflux RND transporter permease subunit [Gemmataceae bacterium]
MFARFFIDRPVFAWVLSIVITLIGAVAVFVLPVDQYPPITPPTVQVTTSYPGASAQVVADTIAAPIEQQVNGVERMLYMSSQSTNDGNYVLTVTFEVGTDLNIAQVLVQNRVALAMPKLPQQVQIQGVNTLKKSPNILLVVNFISPNGRFNDLYLSNYATIHVKDELLRLNGVGDITYLGQRDYSMRLWLDPDKLATRNLTAVDVVNALKNQNVQVAAGQIGQQPVPSGQQFQYPMNALGRLDTEEQFAEIILKTGQGNIASGSGGSPSGVPNGSAALSQGSPSTQVVRIRDVGRIELGAQGYDQIARFNGQPTVGLAIFQLPGSNALDVADAVKKRMKELKKSFPDGVDYRIGYDITPFIRQSVEEVFGTLRDAVLLVALVVLFFLQDWKAMILPMIDVPVSLVGTFAVMAVMGFSLNNLTLFGLVLAIGIVVDDAIMVLENIERLIATGLDARTATIKAMDELTGPIVAITLVLCAVFLPSVFIPGITGQFYRQFALTISVAVIISAVNALTLTPSRAVAIFKTEEAASRIEDRGSRIEDRKTAHPPQREALPWWIFGVAGGLLTVWLGSHLSILDPRSSILEERETPVWLSWAATGAYFIPGLLVGGAVGWFVIRYVNAALAWVFRGFNRGFDRVTTWYGWTVGRLLRLSALVLLLYGGLLFLTVWSMVRAPKGFLPTQDQGYLLVNVQLPDSASVQRTQEVMEKLAKIARGDPQDRRRHPGIPGVHHTLSVAGQSFLLSTNGSNLGSMFVILDEFAQRRSHERYDAVIAQKLQRLAFEEIEDAVIGVFRAPPIRGLGNAGGFKMQTEQRGFVDLNELQASTDELVRAANATGRFAGVFTIFRANTPQIFLDIDRTKVESLDVPIQDVFTTLQVYMGGLYVNDFNKFGRTWQVQVQADAPFRTDADAIQQLKVRNKQGQMVPLGTVTQAKEVGGPLMVMRYNMYTSAAVNGTPAPGVSSGEVIGVMDAVARKAGVPYEWTELTYLEILAGNIALLIFGLGTVLVYLVLAAKYESWRLPLAVILVVPMCLLSSITGMFTARLPVDIFVQIGFLVLVGMASKNAILIVEFARQLREEGKELEEATVEASRLRFRPIVMTSFAFIFGVIPLVLAEGAGAEMRQSLGTAVLSGMIGVTLFGVFLTPVFFHVLMRLGGRTQAGATPVATTPAPVDGAAAGVAGARPPVTVSAFTSGGQLRGDEIRSADTDGDRSAK